MLGRSLGVVWRILIRAIVEKIFFKDRAMPRKAQELSALAIKRLEKRGHHAVGGVAGLLLQITRSGSKSWILRATVGQKRRDIGLGGYPDVTLAEAREKARQARLQIEQGVDPVQARQEVRSQLEAAQQSDITFEKSAREYMASKSKEWRNAKHSQQWENTLRAYAYPTIGKLLVKDIELSHIVKILEPIWLDKTETAKRLRGRIESVLDWAMVRGYRKDENPARWKGFLETILPAPSKISKRKHHKALPVEGVGEFMEALRVRDGVSARALEFLVLTAARSGEVRGATWDEMDLKRGVWTIPASRMKAGKEHRVPLSKMALEILKNVPRFEGVNYCFPAPKGGQLSDMALTSVTRRMELDAVPHGFRSTFRDWAAERTNYPREIAEQALAHTIGKVEAAYRRTDMLEKRRRMMEEWAGFCSTLKAEDKGNKVIAIRGGNEKS